MLYLGVIEVHELESGRNRVVPTFRDQVHRCSIALIDKPVTLRVNLHDHILRNPASVTGVTDGQRITLMRRCIGSSGPQIPSWLELENLRRH